MRRFSILVLLLVIKLSACKDENAKTMSTGTDAFGKRIKRDVKVDSNGKTICNNLWDHSGSTDTGELCEHDFQYDKYDCLILTDKIKQHKGKREFGQKCDVNDGEKACLLVSPITEWRWKNFTDQTLNFVVGDCGRRTNLICHGHFKRCVCGKIDEDGKEIHGEYYQYDKGLHACVIRPGFPCEYEYDCSNGTICTQIQLSDEHKEKVCHCHLQLDFKDDRYAVINSTHWDNWYCTYPTMLPVKPATKRKHQFKFNENNGNTIYGNIIFQAVFFHFMSMCSFTNI